MRRTSWVWEKYTFVRYDPHKPEFHNKIAHLSKLSWIANSCANNWGGFRSLLSLTLLNAEITYRKKFKSRETPSCAISPWISGFWPLCLPIALPRDCQKELDIANIYSYQEVVHLPNSFQEGMHWLRNFTVTPKLSTNFPQKTSQVVNIKNEDTYFLSRYYQSSWEITYQRVQFDCKKPKFKSFPNDSIMAE